MLLNVVLVKRSIQRQRTIRINPRKRHACIYFINIHTRGRLAVFIALKMHQGGRGLVEYAANQ